MYNTSTQGPYCGRNLNKNKLWIMLHEINQNSYCINMYSDLNMYIIRINMHSIIFLPSNYLKDSDKETFVAQYVYTRCYHCELCNIHTSPSFWIVPFLQVHLRPFLYLNNIGWNLYNKSILFILNDISK